MIVLMQPVKYEDRHYIMKISASLDSSLPSCSLLLQVQKQKEYMPNFNISSAILVVNW